MQSRIAVLAIFALYCAGTSASDITPPIKLLDCEKASACVSMLLDVAPDAEQSVIVSPRDADAAESPDGNTDFHVRFEGRLKGKTQTIEATFTGYTEGIHCTSFGQGTVGFLGYSDSGNPIINSSAGPIEVTDARVKVGCDHCMVVHDAKTGKAIAAYRSPGYDLLLTGHKSEDFSYDLPGGYNIKSGNVCLRVPDTGPVKSVYPERCAAPRKELSIELKGEACS